MPSLKGVGQVVITVNVPITANTSKMSSMLCAILHFNCRIVTIHESHGVTDFYSRVSRNKSVKFPKVFLSGWDKLHLVFNSRLALAKDVQMWSFYCSLHINFLTITKPLPCFFVGQIYCRTIQFPYAEQHVAIVCESGVVMPEKPVPLPLVSSVGPSSLQHLHLTPH